MPDNDSLKRLQDLFRELFQLDLADLDFGLYRIFKVKRQEVEAFLSEQLPAEVNAAFSDVTEADKEKLAKRVEELASKVRHNIADDAILPSGDVNPEYEKTKIVGEYRDARERLTRIETEGMHRDDVFNHLYAFFSRYYDDGDFIPRRFFGSGTAYAVPYNGEEVHFHWANKDQYYVKSGEQFRDYAFVVPTTLGEYRVRFRIVEATTAKDNVKGEARHFVPLHEHVTYDEEARTLVVPFEYRVLTEEEKQAYGRNSAAREKILHEYEPKLLDAVTDEALHTALAQPQPTGRETEGQTPPTLLRKRVAHFTKKRTSDFFVHKNLGAFLRQELDFFVRDQVVNALDLEGDVDAKRRMLRVFRKVADMVIAFLAGIEDAQKRLFEKKKLVLRTDWLAPIANVPRELWPEVLANEAQLAEWKALYALEPKSDLFQTEGAIIEHTLETHPTLVVDTRHFPPEFARRLLEPVPDIDGWTDGVLFHSENFQALSLMQERYREQIKCIYIDPPYNTGSSNDFLYKDDYQHSSWASMMLDRSFAARFVAAPTSVIFASTDDGEYSNVRAVLGASWGEPNFVADIIWNSRKSVSSDALISVSTNHTTAFAAIRSALEAAKETFRMPATDNGFANPDGDPLGPWTLDPMDAPNVRENLTYRITNPDTGAQHWPPPGRHWRFEPQQTATLLAEGRIVFGRTGDAKPMFRRYLSEAKVKGRTPTTLWDDVKTTTDATKTMLDLFGDGLSRDVIDGLKPKPTELVERCVTLLTDGTEAVLDYFAGSGTTAHAVMNLNREDGGRRKFILVEMAEYFDTVLVPRIKKVMFTPEWKDGKPKRVATHEEAERTPRLVKVLRLEAYEDALHNTYAEKNLEQGEERAEAVRTHAGTDAYRVRYMLSLPLDTSDSMVRLAALEHPWDASIEVLTDYGPTTSPVDLPETFLWLYGLRLCTTGTWMNPDDRTAREPEGRSYRYQTATDREGNKTILVVWRDMTDFDVLKDRPFLEARAAELGTFDERLVNGDTCAEGFASLDPLFKRLMDPTQ